MAYTVKGSFRPGRSEQAFERSVDANSEKHARDTVLSQLSSEHGISRARITVDEVTEA